MGGVFQGTFRQAERWQVPGGEALKELQPHPASFLQWKMNLAQCGEHTGERALKAEVRVRSSFLNPGGGHCPDFGSWHWEWRETLSRPYQEGIGKYVYV